MKNLLNNRAPRRYRQLQKQIDEIRDFVDSLPKPSPDYSALTPYERDLVEIYEGCLALAAREQQNEDEKQGYSNQIIKLNINLLMPFLSEYLSNDEIEQARNVFNNIPKTIGKKPDRHWTREAKPNLLRFISNEQNDRDWLPKGHLNYKNLRWVGWDELLSLFKNNGYIIEGDDIRQIKSIEQWKNDEKWTLTHLYLEMIDDDALTEYYNSKIKDSRKRFIIRKRFYVYTR